MYASAPLLVWPRPVPDRIMVMTNLIVKNRECLLK